MSEVSADPSGPAASSGQVSIDESAGTRAGHAIVRVLLLLCWCALLRAATVTRSVVDWDESLYFLIADRWRAGDLPYVAVWDHKPIGIYAIFLGAIELFGRSIVSIRLAAILFVFISAELVHRVSLEATRSRSASFVAAFAYPVFSLGLGGTASNTEIFFIAFVLAGLYWLLHAGRPEIGAAARIRRLFVAGLFLGAALQVKYLVILEIGAFAVFYCVGRLRAGHPRGEVALDCAWCAAAIALPSLLAASYYVLHGEWGAFVYANFTANLAHVGDESGEIAKRFLISTYEWAMWVYAILLVVLLGLLTPRRPTGTEGVGRSERSASDDRAGGARTAFIDDRLDRTGLVLLAWLFVCLLESWITKRFYSHYYLVTIPPLCLGLGWAVLRMGFGRMSILASAVLTLGVTGSSLAAISRAQLVPWISEYVTDGGDRCSRLADRIRPLLRPGDFIYVVDDDPILYFQCDARIPTKYPFPPFLIDPHFAHVAAVDFEDELERILSLEPRVVVVRNGAPSPPRVAEVVALLEERYTPIETELGATLYRMVGDGGASTADRALEER